jgi:hypothetical protein
VVVDWRHIPWLAGHVLCKLMIGVKHLLPKREEAASWFRFSSVSFS